MELRTRLAEYMSLRSLGLIFAGTFLFSFGMNVFITPLGLFSGGFLGIAQLVRAFLVNVLGLSLGSADIAGILYFLMSVPLLILAYSQLYRTVQLFPDRDHGARAADFFGYADLLYRWRAGCGRWRRAYAGFGRLRRWGGNIVRVSGAEKPVIQRGTCMYPD